MMSRNGRVYVDAEISVRDALRELSVDDLIEELDDRNILAEKTAGLADVVAEAVRLLELGLLDDALLVLRAPKKWRAEVKAKAERYAAALRQRDPVTHQPVIA